ncbi:RNA-binding S4 domain-containing protein [Massilibacterium senegalense]|uniref:RNA-binding S4 domain-containing protein n=1 Tax=Massilibacterium senegalense TaxID=1632858 RepID=UPI000782AF2F|nr:RNA-binding S4 domain-containing protein [Massilibacterium senegalense]
MRLDKFLKVSRLIKRRTLAKEMAEKGRIMINDQVAKPSSVVKVGDELTVRYGNRIAVVKINELKETVRKEEANDMYTVIKEERIAENPEGLF